MSSKNYKLSVKTGIYSIKPAPIGITILDKSSEYGAAMQTLEYSITSGAVYYNDNLGVVLHTTATNQSEPGTYTIEGAFNNPNYVITFDVGTYTITTPTNALIDMDTGVVVYLDQQYSADLSLNVTTVEDMSKTFLHSAKTQGFEIKAMYNIQILRDNDVVQLDKPIQIKIAVNQEMSAMRGIVLCDCDNIQDVQEIECQLIDGFLCFNTSDTTEIGLASPCATTQQIGNIVTALSVIIGFLVITVIYTIYRNTRLKRKTADSKGNIKYRK